MSRTPAVAASASESADVHAEAARETAKDAANDAAKDAAKDAANDAARDAAEPANAERPSTDVPLREASDEALLEGLRAGSEAHFAELYDRYFQRIYSFVYTRMRNHAEAEEVVQETFLAVFRSFDRYRGQSSLLSWIYGIAKNTANNSIRRSRSQAERIDLADDQDLLPRPSLAAASPSEQLDLSRFQSQLTQRLEALADWQTEIFEMRHFENLSIPEISRRTQRSSDAVRSSLYRVKRVFLEAAQANGMSPAVANGDPS